MGRVIELINNFIIRFKNTLILAGPQQVTN